MPKTRDQRCQRVLNEFFREKVQNLHFILKRENVRGWKYARYEVIIPNKWTINKPYYNSQTRSLTWEQEVKIQDISNTRNIMSNIQNEFKEKFESYEKKTLNNMNAVSFTRIYETSVILEEDIEKIIYKILVVYDKDHIPFPEEIDNDSRLEYLERRNTTLTTELSQIRRETDRYILYMRRRVNRALNERDNANKNLSESSLHFLQQNAKYADAYRNIIRNCYKELNRNFECPVCYENIEIKNIFITPCNHHICMNCSDKCRNTCPLCRQEMSYIPEELDL